MKYEVYKGGYKQREFDSLKEICEWAQIKGTHNFKGVNAILKHPAYGGYDLREMVDEREQAIYKRLSKVKRPKPKVIKFKVGDYVECIGEGKGSDGDETYGGRGWSNGWNFLIIRISKGTDRENDKVDICWNGRGGGGVYAHHLKLLKRPK